MVESVPIASPRRSGATSLVTICTLIGGNPPSAMPISARAASSVRNPTASPELIDAHEKITVPATRSSLLRPVMSASLASPKLDKAQVAARTPVTIPTWELLRENSGWIIGASSPKANRSRNKQPMFKPSRPTSIV
jgi:hypothetical protein